VGHRSYHPGVQHSRKTALMTPGECLKGEGHRRAKSEHRWREVHEEVVLDDVEGEHRVVVVGEPRVDRHDYRCDAYHEGQRAGPRPAPAPRAEATECRYVPDDQEGVQGGGDERAWTRLPCEKERVEMNGRGADESQQLPWNLHEEP